MIELRFNVYLMIIARNQSISKKQTRFPKNLQKFVNFFYDIYTIVYFYPSIINSLKSNLCPTGYLFHTFT